MDYEALFIFLNKPVMAWTILDIKKWLNFINMEKLFPLFDNNRFNGEMLTKTNKKQLTNIGITSNIMQKKLMAWVQKGFVQFDQYLSQINHNKQNICPNFDLRKTQSTKVSKRPLVNQTQIFPEQQPSIRLLLKHFQGSQNTYYIAQKKGLKIGRALANQIQSLQVTVENHHAQIIQQGPQFKLIDLGTKYGSFIKIHYKIQLSQGMLIQIGSYLLKVTSFNILTKSITFSCLNILNNIVEQIDINLSNKTSFSMGRKLNNDFARDDQHMSGSHAKIYFLNGKFILEDMGSTNGTWLRLSQQGQPSPPFTLYDGAIFKIGNTITYICTYQRHKNDSNKMEIEQNSHICLQCAQNERDVLFLPCKHTINCMDCSQNMVECSLCHHSIHEKIKIFI